MIKNLWKMTTFYCSYRHKEPVKMEIIQGPSSPFYACPKYYPQNREEGEPACPMRMNFVDAEGVLNKLSEIIDNDENNDIYKDYTNYEFDYKTIHIKVLKYKEGQIDLDIFNRKAMR